MINKRLLKEARLKRLYMPFSIASSIFNSIFIILNAYLLAFIVNAIFIKHQPIKSIQSYLMLFLANAFIKAMVNYFMEGCIKRYSEEIKENIKKKTFRKIIASNPYVVKEQKIGDLMNLLTDGTEMLTAYYSQYIPQFFSSVIIPISICILVVFVDKLSAVIMLITYPIIPIFMILIGYKSKEANERQWKKLNRLSSHLIDVLQGLRTLKAFGKGKIQEEKIYLASEDHRKSTMEVLKISFLSALVLEMIATVSTALVAVDLGLRLIYYKIDFLTAFFILIITPDFYLPLRQLGLKFHASLNGQVAIEKLEALENTLGYEAEEENSKAFRMDPIEVEINDLSFSHENKEALHNISFKISPKEKLALVGASGSGKSTLINILCGFLPVEDNQVFFNGIDINKANRDELASKFALVPQFPHIFNMSIKENILLGSQSISDDEFYRICEISRINEFAKKFKDGFHTIIGDGEAVKISGGEKQRIAIARALVKNADFVIFDEPTSALDAETEDLFSNMINDYFKDKTILIAAHRLNTIKASDTIIVLNNGKLVESGNHETLKSRKGFYYNMIQAAQE